VRATATYDLLSTDLIPARKRILEEHYEIGSWHKLSRIKRYRMNWRYIYNFGVRGKLPKNPLLRRRLLGRKTINEHLAMDLISDMPTDLLALALEKREEIKP
jgi:hypothetical protein